MYLKTLLSYSVLFATCVLPYSAQAQQQAVLDTTNISEVIITENRLQIPFSKNSRNIEIITQEEIRRMPARTVNELLQHVNGVDLRQRGPFGAQADIGIDGGTFEQTLVLINGVKISDPQTGHHNLNLPIPLEAIERIEVLRGPASRMYGINALTGSINIVTRSIDTDAVFAHVYGGSSFKEREEAGKDGIYHGSGIQVGGQLAREGHQHQLFFTTESGNGFRYNTATESYRAHYDNKIQINDRVGLEVMGGYVYNDFGANGFYAAPGDIESREIVQTVLASAGAHIRLSDRFHLSPRISNRYNEDDYRYFRHDISQARSEHSTNVLGVELNGLYHTEIGDIGIGAESRSEQINSTNIGDYRRHNYGFYGEFKTEYIRNLLVNGGVYVNYNSQFGWQAFPGVDLSYQLASNWRLGANIGSSQRIPTFTDLYLNQPVSIGNPDLISENAWQAEGLLKYLSGDFSAQASYFYRDVMDFIDWVSPAVGDPFSPVNISSNRIHGVNTTLKYRNVQWDAATLHFSLGYSYLSPSAIAFGTHQISRYGVETLRHQLIGVVNARIRGFMTTLSNRLIERTNSPEYLLTDMRVGYDFGVFDAYADLQNTWDVTYIEAGAVPMPGRWLSLGIRYHWSK